MEAFDLADVAGGEMFTRPLGTAGDRDRGYWNGPTPDECEGCHEMSIVIETVSGTPARIAYGGVDDPLRQSTTELVWAQGTIEPGKPQIYTLSHDYVRYMDIDPDRPMDILSFDDPRYEDEDALPRRRRRGDHRVPPRRRARDHHRRRRGGAVDDREHLVHGRPHVHLHAGLTGAGAGAGPAGHAGCSTVHS